MNDKLQMNDKLERLKTNRVAAVLIINMVTLSWAGNMVLGRWLKDYIQPFSLSAMRYLIAFVIFFFVLQKQSLADKSPKGDRKLLFAMACCGVVLFPCLLYLGLRYTSAINATIINGSGPLLTMVLAGVLFGETIIMNQVLGVIIGFLGVVVLISQGNLKVLQELTFNSGDIIIFAGVACWSFYTLLRKKISPWRSSISTTAFSVIFGLPFLLIIALPEFMSHSPIFNINVFLAVLFMGFFPSFISLVAWNHGVSVLGTKVAMAYFNTIPVYGLLLSMLILGESVTSPQIVGIVLVISGTLWTTISDRPG